MEWEKVRLKSQDLGEMDAGLVSDRQLHCVVSVPFKGS